jgi:hypothetical protein
MSSDGQVLVHSYVNQNGIGGYLVGGYYIGTATTKIYTKSLDKTWQLKQSLTNMPHGWNSAINYDGSVIAIGGYVNQIYVGDKNAGWKLANSIVTLEPNNTESYKSYISISENANRLDEPFKIAIGHSYANKNSGVVRVYKHAGGYSINTQYLNSFNLQLVDTLYGSGSSEYFGLTTAVNNSANQEVILVGGYSQSKIYTCGAQDVNKFKLKKVITGLHAVRNRFDTMSNDASTIIVGGYKAGVAGSGIINIYTGYLQSYASGVDGNWNLAQYINAPISYTASHFYSINNDSSIIAVGGYNNISIYTGVKKQSGWALLQSIPSNNYNNTVLSINKGVNLTNNFIGGYISNIVIGGYANSSLFSESVATPSFISSIEDIEYYGEFPGPISYVAPNFIGEKFNGIYDYKIINSGTYSGAKYFEGKEYILGHPAFKIDPYWTVDYILTTGTNIQPQSLSGQKFYKINSTFLNNDIYTDKDEQYILWKSGNSNIWNITDNNPLIDGRFTAGFTGNPVGPFTGINFNYGRLIASGSSYSGSLFISTVGKYINMGRCSSPYNTGNRIWNILDTGYNSVGIKNCATGTSSLPFLNWNSGNVSLYYQYIEYYKHKIDFVKDSDSILNIDTGYNYNQVSGIFGTQSGQSFVFNLFNDKPMTGIVEVNNSGLVYGPLNNGHFLAVEFSGNNAAIDIYSNLGVYYNIYKSGNSSTIIKLKFENPVI